jgi:5-methylcytosine-specific restriction endonuclease McrA
MPSHSGDPRRGHRWRQFRLMVFEHYGPWCCLGPDCRLGDARIDLGLEWTRPPHPGYGTVHHLIAVRTAPHLAYELSNARPAHWTCNTAQGTRPLAQTRRTRARW